jgi:hypothetical protein
MNTNEPPLHDRIAAWLQAQGHRTETVLLNERHSSIEFVARGYRLSVRIDATDEHFLHVALTLDIPESVVDELLARRATAAVEAHAKVVKVELAWPDRSVTIAGEQFVTTPGGPDIFWRTVSCLVHSVDQLWVAFNDEAGRAAANEFTVQLEAELAAKDAS